MDGASVGATVNGSSVGATDETSVDGSSVGATDGADEGSEGEVEGTGSTVGAMLEGE